MNRVRIIRKCLRKHIQASSYFNPILLFMMHIFTFIDVFNEILIQLKILSYLLDFCHSD